MASRQILAVAAFALGLTVASAAHADEQLDLDLGRSAYEAKNYEDADKRFRTMLDPATGSLKNPALIKQARMYWAAVMLGLNRTTEANAIFEKLLLDDASFEPDPLSFPSSVIEAFIKMRAKMRNQLTAAAADQAKREADRRVREEAEKKRQIERVKLLEKWASEETITHTHSRWIAMIPFGAGQFQNRQPVLGWVFASTELALIGAGLITYPIYYQQKSDAFARYSIGDTNGYTGYIDHANVVRIFNGVFYGAAAAVAVAGVIHAQITFAPQQVETKKRVLPIASITPIVAPQMERGGVGGVFGISGTF